MTTYKSGAAKIHTLIRDCSKIEACAPLLKKLLSQCPVGVNFSMESEYNTLVFKGSFHPSIWTHGLGGLFNNDRKRFWHTDITLQEYNNGCYYNNETQFEFSAEQWDTLTKLDLIKQDYLKEVNDIQKKLCSKYIAPSLSDVDDTTKDNEVKRLTY